MSNFEGRHKLHNSTQKKLYIYAEVDIDKAYSEITSKSKKIPKFLQNNHLSYDFVQKMRNYKNLRICFDNQIQHFIHEKQLASDLRVIKKNVFIALEQFIIERYRIYIEDERLHEEYESKVEQIQSHFAQRLKQLTENMI